MCRVSGIIYSNLLPILPHSAGNSSSPFFTNLQMMPITISQSLALYFNAISNGRLRSNAVRP